MASDSAPQTAFDRARLFRERLAQTRNRIVESTAERGGGGGPTAAEMPTTLAPLNGGVPAVNGGAGQAGSGGGAGVASRGGGGTGGEGVGTGTRDPTRSHSCLSSHSVDTHPLQQASSIPYAQPSGFSPSPPLLSSQSQPETYPTYPISYTQQHEQEQYLAHHYDASQALLTHSSPYNPYAPTTTLPPAYNPYTAAPQVNPQHEYHAYAGAQPQHPHPYQASPSSTFFVPSPVSAPVTIASPTLIPSASVDAALATANANLAQPRAHTASSTWFSRPSPSPSVTTKTPIPMRPASTARPASEPDTTSKDKENGPGASATGSTGRAGGRVAAFLASTSSSATKVTPRPSSASGWLPTASVESSKPASLTTPDASVDVVQPTSSPAAPSAAPPAQTTTPPVRSTTPSTTPPPTTPAIVSIDSRPPLPASAPALSTSLRRPEPFPASTSSQPAQQPPKVSAPSPQPAPATLPAKPASRPPTPVVPPATLPPKPSMQPPPGLSRPPQAPTTRPLTPVVAPASLPVKSPAPPFVKPVSPVTTSSPAPAAAVLPSRSSSISTPAVPVAPTPTPAPVPPPHQPKVISISSSSSASTFTLASFMRQHSNARNFAAGTLKIDRGLVASFEEEKVDAAISMRRAERVEGELRRSWREQIAPITKGVKSSSSASTQYNAALHSLLFLLLTLPSLPSFQTPALLLELPPLIEPLVDTLLRFTAVGIVVDVSGDGAREKEAKSRIEGALEAWRKEVGRLKMLKEKEKRNVHSTNEAEDLRDAQGRINRLEMRLQARDKEIKTAQDEAKDWKEKAGRAEARLEEKPTLRAELLLEEKVAISAQRDEALSTLSTLQAEHDSLSDELATLRASASSAAASGATSKEVLRLQADLRKMVDARDRAIGSADADRYIFEDKEKRWSNSLEAAKARLIEHEAKVAAVKKELASEKRARESEMREKEKREEELKREVLRLRTREKEMEKEVEEKKERVKALEKEKAKLASAGPSSSPPLSKYSPPTSVADEASVALTTKLKQSQKDLSSAQFAVSRLSRQVRALNDEVAELRTENGELMIQLTSE